MLKRVFIWILAALILAILVLLFINGGGFSGIVKTGRSITSVGDFFFGSGSPFANFVLPGQADVLKNLEVQIDMGAPGVGYETPALSGAYAPEVQTAGNPSPFHGFVTLSAGNATAARANEEYVLLQVPGGSAVNVSGWSLQSMVSGVRIYIPLAASPFILGIVNRVGDAVLSPGSTAVVSSGVSPIGVSFRETRCTGYLNQMQSFTPPLINSCPARDRVLAMTQSNTTRYGANCLQYIQNLPACDFPTSIPTSLSAACRDLLTTAFSYNGCVNMFRNAPDFALTSWRLYGSVGREAWRNDHDVIRLLDKEGRIVDSISY